MDLNEIVQAIGGPTEVPVQPEGGSDVRPLEGHGDGQPVTEVAPADVSSLQGAGTFGSSGGLTPNPQEPTSGAVMKGYRGPSYSDAGPDNAPASFPAVESVPDKLTGGFVMKPLGGEDGQVAVPADPAGIDQQQYGEGDAGLGLNPALGQAPKRIKAI